MTKGRSGPNGLVALTTFKQIAERTGWSERAVFNYYHSAINKLQNAPGVYEVLLTCVRGVAADEHDLLQAGSLECNREARELFSDGGSE